MSQSAAKQAWSTTAGDAPQVLVAFNPAALKVNLPLIADGALIILNIDSFTSRGLAKAGYEKDPRQSGVLDGYQVIEVDITKHTLLLGIEERCLAMPAFQNAAPDRQPDAVK